MVARIYEIRKRGKRKKIILMYERREQAKMPVLFLCAARGEENVESGKEKGASQPASAKNKN